MASRSLVRLLPLALALALAGCPSPQPAAPERAPAVDAGAPGAAAACVPGDALCASEDTANVCDPRGLGWRSESCDAATTCLAGRCVAVAASPFDGERALPKAAFLAIAREGWLNAWAMRAPLNVWQVDALLDAAMRNVAPKDPEKLPPPRPLCAPGGLLTPQKGPGEPGHSVLSGIVISPRAGRAELWVGVAGKVRVVVNGKLALSAEGDADTSAFPDEVRAPVDLVAGPNRIVVGLEQTLRASAPASLWIRLRAPGHEPFEEALFAPGPTPGATCTAGALADVQVTPRAVPGGFDLAVASRFRGLAPRGSAPVPWRVQLAEGASVVDVAKGEHRAAEMSGDGARASVHVDIQATVGRRKQGTFAARVGVAGGSRDAALVYRAALHEHITALEGRRAKLDPAGATSGDRESLEYQVRSLQRALDAGDPDIGWITERATEADALLDAFVAGKNPYRTTTGVVQRAYRSRLDGELQPYLLFVPRKYKPGAKPLPLVLAIHGLNGEPGQALRTVMGEPPDRDDMNVLREARHMPFLPDSGVFVAAPWGYGNSGQRLPGEDDVLRVIDELHDGYGVDEKRTSITGYSLGGTVSFVVPLHYPDRFSAAAPLCGYPNLAGWSDVRDVPHQPWEDVLVQNRAIVNYAENGLHVPLHIVHGGQDGPDRSAVIADRYRDLGYRRIFDIQDDLDHDVWEYGYDKGRMVGWLRAQKAPDVPASVRLRTGELRYDRAYWIRLLAMSDLAKLSRIEAAWDAHACEVRLKTDNVDALGLDLPALAPTREVRIVVDDAVVAPCAGASTTWLVREKGAWACTAKPPSLAGRKRAGVAGPLDDVQRHTALVVYGTGTPGAAEVNRLVAERFAQVESSTLRWPIKADTEVTDADIASRSLILIGRPAVNRVAALLAGALPVIFDDNGIVVRGKRYEGTGVGVSLIAPNPRNADEYVVLHAGVGPEGTLASRHLATLSPDWIVYDTGITAARKGLLLGRRKVLDGGFFDASWR